MKRLVFMTIVLLIQSFAWANIGSKPEVYHSAPGDLYIPQGFDDNDNVEIFFEGLFTDACHKAGLATHTVDEESRSIYITNDSYYFGDAFCASVVVPYQKSINAGMLREGEYRVLFKHSRGNFVDQGIVPVKKSGKQQSDDFLYAPVEKTKFHAPSATEPAILELSGRFFNTCMRMDFVKVQHRNYSNVIDILPIAIMDRGGCEAIPGGTEFTHRVKLNDLRPGRFLIHTRALNGQSVNEIVTVR